MRHVTFTPIFLEEVMDVSRYIQVEFGEVYAKTFLHELEYMFDLISYFSEMGKVYKSNAKWRYFIFKQNAIIYKFNNKEIKFINFISRNKNNYS